MRCLVFQTRSKTTDVEWLTEKNSLDFNGTIISMDDVRIYMDMQPYIARSLALFGMDGDDCASLAHYNVRRNHSQSIS